MSDGSRKRTPMQGKEEPRPNAGDRGTFEVEVTPANGRRRFWTHARHGCLSWGAGRRAHRPRGQTRDLCDDRGSGTRPPGPACAPLLASSRCGTGEVHGLRVDGARRTRSADGSSRDVARTTRARGRRSHRGAEVARLSLECQAHCVRWAGAVAARQLRARHASAGRHAWLPRRPSAHHRGRGRDRQSSPATWALQPTTTNARSLGLRAVWLRTNGTQVLATLVTSEADESEVRRLSARLTLCDGVACSFHRGSWTTCCGERKPPRFGASKRSM